MDLDSKVQRWRAEGKLPGAAHEARDGDGDVAIVAADARAAEFCCIDGCDIDGATLACDGPECPLGGEYHPQCVWPELDGKQLAELMLSPVVTCKHCVSSAAGSAKAASKRKAEDQKGDAEKKAKADNGSSSGSKSSSAASSGGNSSANRGGGRGGRRGRGKRGRQSSRGRGKRME